jgi:hypothetical protein
VQEDVITPDMPLEQWAREIFDAPKKVEDRPEVSPAAIREVITRQMQNGGGQQGNTNATGTRQGNMGKGNNPT